MNRPLESYPDSPDLFRQFRQLYAHPALERQPGGWKYKGVFYPDYLTVGGAGHAIFRVAGCYCQGVGVDIGAGIWPLPGATPIDVWRGPGTGNSIDDFENGTLDFVFSSHCLEHIVQWQETLTKWVDKLKLNGIIFLYLPHPECKIWEPGSPMIGNGHVWIPTCENIKTALLTRNCEIVSFDDGPDAMYSFYVCGKRK